MKRRKPPSPPFPADVQDFHARREGEQLRRQYKSNGAILSQLREIPAHRSTYDFLGELFFNAAARELENDPPSDDWIKQLRDVRNDVYELFELARAARELKSRGK